MTSAFVERLRSADGTIAVELRPPRSGLVAGPAMDTWIDLGRAARSLSRRDAFVLLTDGAIGDAEEENLRHLSANLAGASGDTGIERLVPFLTCKHSLSYCLWFADRARRHGIETLTVVGGDMGDGIERCLPHSYQLRQRLRDRHPDLALGGWVNPHGDTDRQAEYLASREFAADYYLTQVVTHHDMGRVESWRRAAEERGIDLPAAWGVFYYRNGRRTALGRLAEHFAVPVDALAEEFEAGTSATEVCARTIRALRAEGIDDIYLCNLGARHAGTRLDAIHVALEGEG